MDFILRFNYEKSQLLKSTRGVGFEDVLELIKSDALLANIASPNSTRPHQRVFIVQIKNYAYAIPYVIDLQKEEIFLKTLYASRKFTSIYIKETSMVKSNINDPFSSQVLDTEEQALEDAIEKGEFEELPNFEETKKMLQKAALQYTTLNTTKPITLRVKQMDLIKIKAKASRNGIPYQTMLSALLHDFADDKRELTIK